MTQIERIKEIFTASQSATNKAMKEAITDILEAAKFQTDIHSYVDFTFAAAYRHYEAILMLEIASKSEDRYFEHRENKDAAWLACCIFVTMYWTARIGQQFKQPFNVDKFLDTAGLTPDTLEELRQFPHPNCWPLSSEMTAKTPIGKFCIDSITLYLLTPAMRVKYIEEIVEYGSYRKKGMSVALLELLQEHSEMVNSSLIVEENHSIKVHQEPQTEAGKTLITRNIQEFFALVNSFNGGVF